MKAKLIFNTGSRKRYVYRGYLIERCSMSCWVVCYNGDIVEHSTSLSRSKDLVDWRIYCGYDI